MMENKVIIELNVPDIEEVFNLFIPINRRIGNIIILINKAINEMTNGEYYIDNKRSLYNKLNGRKYLVNDLVRDTDIRNGSKLVLL